MIRTKYNFKPFITAGNAGASLNQYDVLDVDVIASVQPSEKLTLDALNAPIESPFQHVPNEVVESSET